MGLTDINSRKVINWGVNTKNATVLKREYVANNKLILLIKGMYINTKSKYYKEQGVYICELNNKIYLIDAPNSHLDIIKASLSDNDEIERIKNGCYSLRCYDFYNKQYDRVGYGVDIIEN